MPFPKGFVWGAASSAYQIEGASREAGKGPSIWDAYCHAPPSLGNVWQNQTGDIACDHYHRFREDIGLMKRIGLKAYRFSVSWPRVLPEGTGRVNGAGLEFYDRLVDELLGAGIEPWVTLFHWDLPLALYHRGGWLNRDIAGWFAEYASVVVGALSDRVKRWITLNEPQIFLGPNENEGPQCSGSRKPHGERLLAAHHALLTHGRGAAAIRASWKRKGEVGWAPIGRIRVPASESPRDVEAARLATLSVMAKDFWNNTWFADPVVLGRYPEDGLKLYGDDVPRVRDGDMEAIAQPLDFYGMNVYDAERYRMGAGGQPEKVEFPPGHPQTAIRWFIEPECLYYGPKFLQERYRLPIVITDNGMSSHDWVSGTRSAADRLHLAPPAGAAAGD
jgi:beta-glucosidase